MIFFLKRVRGEPGWCPVSLVLNSADDITVEALAPLGPGEYIAYETELDPDADQPGNLTKLGGAQSIMIAEPQPRVVASGTPADSVGDQLLALRQAEA